MALGIIDDVLLLDTLVNAQHGNIVLAVNGFVLHQCHVRHSNNGWNRAADGQLGSTATCLFFVE